MHNTNILFLGVAAGGIWEARLICLYFYVVIIMELLLKIIISCYEHITQVFHYFQYQLKFLFLVQILFLLFLILLITLAPQYIFLFQSSFSQVSREYLFCRPSNRNLTSFFKFLKKLPGQAQAMQNCGTTNFSFLFHSK